MGAKTSKHLSAEASERDRHVHGCTSSGRPRLPKAFIEIAKSIEDDFIEVKDLQQVPDAIKENRAW